MIDFLKKMITYHPEEVEQSKESDELVELKKRWPLFEIQQVENGYSVKSPNRSIFNLYKQSNHYTELLKNVDREHSRATTDHWLKEKFPFLNFYGIQVSCNGVKLDYEINPTKLESNMGYLAHVNAEAELIYLYPDKYTMCSYCHHAVPHDYIAFKKTGVCCKSCADIKGKVLC